MNTHEKRAISDWIVKGVNKGYIAGPYDLDYKFPWQLHCSPLFVVPKPGFRKYRPIVHLSWKQYGKYFSVNELLCEYMKTVQYIKFKQVVNLVNNAGHRAYIFLIDAQDAYYRVPIHPDDFKYNGLKWNKKFWVLRSLQMGLSSSPKIYTEFADAIEWICVNKYKNDAFYNKIQQLRHYIDDFFGCCPTLAGARRLYNGLFSLMEELGIPTRLDKCTPPCWSAKILGWIYNTDFRHVEYPNDKRIELIAIIEKLLLKRRSDKKSLERLIGKLTNASLIIFPGKAFVRRLQAILYLPGLLYNVAIPLNDFICEDLQWWLNILNNKDLCCTSFDLLLKLPSDGDFHIYTDASSKIGVGGHMEGRFFQVAWHETCLFELMKLRDNFDIELLELVGTLIAVTLWSKYFTNKSVTLYNDNPGAASAIRTKAPRLHRLDMQFLIRDLAQLAVNNKFYFWGLHITQKEDTKMSLADNLSRFFSKNTDLIDLIDDSANALIICNNILKILGNLPSNLPKNRDISVIIRREYNILLDDDALKSQLIKMNNDILIEQKQYNILS